MENQSAHTLLRVNNLVVEYPPHSFFGRAKPVSRRAVDQVSFEVIKGETLALVGESGSGKTSIAMAILGFATPTGGKMEFDGVELNEMTIAKFRSRIQPIFQDAGAALNPQMKIGRAIGDGFPSGLSSGQNQIRVLELMKKVSLDEIYFNAYPRQLSGGQKQRVCLARALAVGAGMLILDEPFSAQDISIQVQLMSLLRDLKAALGLTLLLISHDLTTVRLLADRILVMRAGKIVESGTVTDIIAKPQTDYARELIRQAGIKP